MKSQRTKKYAVRLSVVAVQSAVVLIAMGSIRSACADDQTAEELSIPMSNIEVGAVNLSEKSAKFGEYNGLHKKGASADVNFELRGNGVDQNDPTRFRISGNNLGLETRDLSIDYAQQGSFRLKFGYDELLHNISDSFQTPYLGVGTNVLTVPDTWVRPTQRNVNPNAATAVTPGYNANALSPSWIANDTIYRFNNTANNNNAANGASIAANATGSNVTGPMQAYAASAAQQAAMLATAATDNALFRNVDLYTKRTKYKADIDFILNNQWSFSLGASQEKKTGLKPKSYIPTGNETGSIFSDPIDEDHARFSLSANFHRENSFLNAVCNASLYSNHVNGVTVEEIGGSAGRNLATPGASATTATAPSNQFHQFALTGGYNFSKATKLVGDFSYSRNTQDQAFLTNSLPTTPVPAILGTSWLPTSSLHGKVITKNFDLKLTHKATSAINLAAAYKYNDRNNQTPVNTYVFQDLESATSGNSPYNAPLGLPASAIGAGNNGGILANRAFSKKVHQLNLDADYRIAPGQSIKIGYDWQKVERYCEGSWIACATSESTKEDTARADWRFNPSETLSGRIGYAYSERRANNYNINAWMALAPMAGIVPDQTVLPTGGFSAYNTMQMFGLSAWGPMGQGYPLVVALGTANPGQGYTAAQWQTALGLAALPSAANVTSMNALSKAQWGTYLNLAAANISDKQLAALNQYFALGNKLAGANVATRNFLALMPGQQLPFDGDRNRDKVRTMLSWQASEKLSFDAGMDYNKDKYTNTNAGLEQGKSWNVNLDAAYNISDDFNGGLFYTHENRQTSIAGPGVGSNAAGNAAATGSLGNTAAGSLVGNDCNGYTSNAQSLVNAKIDPCLDWTTNIKDKVNTFGLNLRHKNLLGGKFELTGNASYTKAVTSQDFPTGGVYVSTLLTTANFGVGATAWSRTFVPASSMPDVKSKVISLSVSGKYALNKVSAVQVGYRYQHLTYDDWLYANNVAGVTPTNVLPSNITTPTYNLHAIGVTYLYSFR